MELHTIAIDLGKTVFHLVGLKLRGKVVVCKNFHVRGFYISLAWRRVEEPIFSALSKPELASSLSRLNC